MHNNTVICSVLGGALYIDHVPQDVKVIVIEEDDREIYVRENHVERTANKDEIQFLCTFLGDLFPSWYGKELPAADEVT